MTTGCAAVGGFFLYQWLARLADLRPSMLRRSAPSWCAALTASRAFGIPQGKSGRVLFNIPLQQKLCPRAWRNAPERTSRHPERRRHRRRADGRGGGRPAGARTRRRPAATGGAGTRGVSRRGSTRPPGTQARRKTPPAGRVPPCGTAASFRPWRIACRPAGGWRPFEGGGSRCRVPSCAHKTTTPGTFAATAPASQMPILALQDSCIAKPALDPAAICAGQEIEPAVTVLAFVVRRHDPYCLCVAGSDRARRLHEQESENTCPQELSLVWRPISS
ncbi:hypothetical protein C8N38_1183 [Rhodovulum kholense]|uniref:Uncharacterized protein n=1 Tax=Rhodovulum kholense TaxID=453584 RepID=A0A8E3APH2_9RHOB|nr:hypothetical protein C8N38_1183 [Rhodovulum kholense]